MFTGFTDETIAFFLGIRFDNSKAYMDAHRQMYADEVRQRFYELIDDLADTALMIDPDIEIRPHKCLSRINRDIRFSRDKSPYRDHLWFCFRRSGADKALVPNYWFEMGPDNISWGLGSWFEQKEAMEIMRRKMIADPDSFLKMLDILDKNGLVLEGNGFKRLEIPQEIPEKLHEWYRKRDIYFTRPVVKMSWAFDQGLTKRIQKDYLTLRPMYEMLRGCMDEANNVMTDADQNDRS